MPNTDKPDTEKGRPAKNKFRLTIDFEDGNRASAERSILRVLTAGHEYLGEYTCQLLQVDPDP